MTLQEFEERFAAAAPGEIIVYYTGHLAQNIILNFTLSQIARTARELGTPKDCYIFVPLRDPSRAQVSQRGGKLHSAGNTGLERAT